jgi:hypothetical protein
MDGGTSDTSTLPLEELEARITEMCGHLNAAQYRWLLLIREFDRRRGWGDGKLASCAHWLNFKCGLNLGAARSRCEPGEGEGGDSSNPTVASLPTAATRWRGERMDYDHGVMLLCHKAERAAADVSAETLVQRDSASATASAPAAMRLGDDGSVAARHTASATSRA